MNDIGSPMRTPNVSASYNSTVIELYPNVQNTIDNIERGKGNNYLRGNAMDRAMAREGQAPQQYEQPQQVLGR